MRISYLTSHPIQYQAPLFRRLAAEPGVEFEVLFCHQHGVRASYDPGFGRTIRYDVSLLEGYRHRFLRNLAPRPSLGLTGMVNPSVVVELAGRRTDAMIVHGYAALTNLLAAWTPRRRPLLLLRSESHLNEPRGALKRALKRAVLPRLLTRFDHFLAIGSLNWAYYESYGVPGDRITLAPYSVDNDYFFAGAAKGRGGKERLRARLGLASGEVLFLLCAKLIAKKRPLDALRALAHARPHAACGLVVVGDGPLRPQLEQETARLGLEEAVRFLGFKNQSELPEIYAACDVLVLPSGDEPWGLVVNEAMACGLAIACSDGVGAAADLVADNGAMFPVGDEVRLAELMVSWATHRERLEQMKRASLARISHFGLDQTVRGTVAGVEAAQRSKIDVRSVHPPLSRPAGADSDLR